MPKCGLGDHMKEKRSADANSSSKLVSIPSSSFDENGPVSWASAPTRISEKRLETFQLPLSFGALVGMVLAVACRRDLETGVTWGELLAARAAEAGRVAKGCVWLSMLSMLYRPPQDCACADEGADVKTPMPITQANIVTRAANSRTIIFRMTFYLFQKLDKDEVGADHNGFFCVWRMCKEHHSDFALKV